MTAVPDEQMLEIPARAIEGRLPSELAGGRHLQNGPGWTRIGDRLAHPFDGHGFVRALEFTDDGGVRFRSRYVETPVFVAERAAGRLIGCNVYRESPSRFVFREFDASGSEVAEREVKIPGMHFEHDFVVTPRWYVLAGNPMKASLPKFARVMLGMGSLIEALRTDESKPGELYLIPRGRPGPVRTIRLPQRAFVIHFANAHDPDDTTCVVVMCAFESFEFGEEFGFQGPRKPLDPALPDRRPSFQRLYRATIRDDRDSADWEQLSDYGMDFPRVHPAREERAAPAIYAAARSNRVKPDPFDALVRVDTVDRARPTEVWSAPPGRFVGEPVFAPRPGAADLDDGWVVAVVYDGVSLAARFCVFEAAGLSRGPIAVVPLPLQPYGFHGFWESAAA